MRPPVAAATAVPPAGQLGRRRRRGIRLSHHRSALFLGVRDQLEICSTVAGDLLESTESCRSVCLGENTDLSIVVIGNGIRGPGPCRQKVKTPLQVTTMTACKRSKV
jgi:hypothetical protein